MYLCPKGSTLYGVFSNAGFLVGTITNRTVQGTWYEGGTGDRTLLQGSFQLTLQADNNGFDGYWNQQGNGDPRRWRERRLGAPYPSNPTNQQCLVPYSSASIVGTFFGGSIADDVVSDWSICIDDYYNAYASTDNPPGYVIGWEVDSTGFQGYYYSSDGTKGSIILVATSSDQLTGFGWLGSPITRNYPTSQQIVLTRATVLQDIDSCNGVGPGLPTRLHGNSASLLSISPLLLAALSFLLFF